MSERQHNDRPCGECKWWNHDTWHSGRKYGHCHYPVPRVFSTIRDIGDREQLDCSFFEDQEEPSDD